MRRMIFAKYFRYFNWTAVELLGKTHGLEYWKLSKTVGVTKLQKNLTVRRICWRALGYMMKAFL